MNIFRSLLVAIKFTYSNKKLIFILYSINLIFALSLAFPFKDVISDTLSKIKISEILSIGFNYTVIADFLNQKLYEIGLLFQFIFIFFMLYLILNIFLTGGILSIWNEKDKKVIIKDYFSNCSKYFIRFLKSTLFSWVIFIIIFIIIVLIGSVGGIIVAASRSSFLTILIIFGIISILFFAFYILVSDYIKIHIVFEDSKKILKSVKEALLFVIRNYFTLFSVIFVIFTFFGIISLFFYFMRFNLISNTGFLIIVVFILQQIYVVLRVFLRIMVFGTEYIYFENKKVLNINNNYVELNSDKL